MCRLMREFSSTRASNSLETKMVSKWSTWETICLVLAVWEALSWKYWLTRFLSFFALPT